MFKVLINRILKKEKAGGEVNLVLLNDAEIRKLNRKYRGKDKATDVLAFPMNEDGIVGDIAISTETARKNARRFGVNYREEMKRLVIHGTLHLLGYDHGEKMRHAEKIYKEL
ncbi:rRNA maturation RNase YbeY [Candidatus Margulisiibacteriota bacterium]